MFSVNHCDMLRLIWRDLIGFPRFVYPSLQTNELLGRLAIALPGFGINVTFELWSCSNFDVVLIIVHDKIFVLIGTRSLTWDNSATKRVVWDALSELNRKASGGLPYPKGARAIEELQYREILGLIMLRWLFGWGIPILPFSETVAGFLKLVELCKGLVVLPCLISSIEMNGKSWSLGKWVTWLVGK
jgi:hypothetical protein